jgi:hypothetical protein
MSAFHAEDVITPRPISLNAPRRLEQSLGFQPPEKGVKRTLIDLQPLGFEGIDE